MLGRWLLFAGLLALSVAANASAQAPLPPPYDRNCSDEYGRNWCDATLRDHILRSFGLQPAEAVPAGDRPQLRVFMIDGYGRDLPAMVFTGFGGGVTRIDIYSQLAAPSRRGPSLSILDEDAFGATASMAETTRRSPVKADPLPPAEGASGLPPPPCVHAWTSMIEVIDPAGVTRRVRNACQQDVVFALAIMRGDLALALLPQCGALKAGYREPFEVIDACATLSGDTAVAAAVRMKLDDRDVRRWAGRADPDLTQLLAEGVTLRHSGREVVGAAEVAQALDAVRGVQFSSRVHASSDSAVEVTAEIMKREEKDGVGRASFAPVTQHWVRTAGEWRIAAIEVGPYAPPARPDQEVTGIWGE